MRSLYLKSFREMGWHSVHTMAYDILQYLCIMAGYLVVMWSFNSIYTPVASVMSQAQGINTYIAQARTLPPLTSELRTMMQTHESLIKMFIAQLITLSIGALVYLIAVSSIFRHLLYCKLYPRAPRRFILFAKRNSLWLMLWLIVVGVTAAIISLKYVGWIFVAEIALFLHLSFIFRSRITDKKSIWNTMRETFSVGVGKMHRFLVPWAMVLLTGIVLLFVGYLDRLLPIPYVILIAFIASIMYISWVRTYYALVVKEVP